MKKMGKAIFVLVFPGPFKSKGSFLCRGAVPWVVRRAHGQSEEPMGKRC